MQRRGRSKNSLVNRTKNPVKYANELASSLTLEGALKTATECKNGCERVLAQGDFLHATKEETIKTLGFYTTVSGYLKRKFEAKGGSNTR